MIKLRICHTARCASCTAWGLGCIATAIVQHKGPSIKDIRFFSSFWTPLLTYILFLGPFFDHLTYLYHSYIPFLQTYLLTGMRDILYGRPPISNLPSKCLIKLVCKMINFLKNADYGKFETLRTRLSKFWENFKNIN